MDKKVTVEYKLNNEVRTVSGYSIKDNGRSLWISIPSGREECEYSMSIPKSKIIQSL